MCLAQFDLYWSENYFPPSHLHLPKKEKKCIGVFVSCVTILIFILSCERTSFSRSLSVWQALHDGTETMAYKHFATISLVLTWFCDGSTEKEMVL